MIYQFCVFIQCDGMLFLSIVDSRMLFDSSNKQKDKRNVKRLRPSLHFVEEKKQMKINVVASNKFFESDFYADSCLQRRRR